MNEIQVSWLVSKFFGSSFAGGNAIARSLILNGSCITTTGGIFGSIVNSFITEVPYVIPGNNVDKGNGLITLTFDLEGFVSESNEFFKTAYDEFVLENTTLIAELQDRLDKITLIKNYELQ